MAGAPSRKPPEFPTLEQMEAEIRRRPIGRAIADICRDLGIAPSLCERLFSDVLYQAMTCYRGNYLKDMLSRELDLAAEDQDWTFTLDWPEQKRD